MDGMNLYSSVHLDSPFHWSICLSIGAWIRARRGSVVRCGAPQPCTPPLLQHHHHHHHHCVHMATLHTQQWCVIPPVYCLYQ